MTLPLDVAVERSITDAAAFDHDKLKHVETEVKESKPTSQGGLLNNLRTITVDLNLCIRLFRYRHREGTARGCQLPQRNLTPC